MDCLLIELMDGMEEAYIEEYVSHSWRTIAFKKLFKQNSNISMEINVFYELPIFILNPNTPQL
jgi:hypothetical protein